MRAGDAVWDGESVGTKHELEFRRLLEKLPAAAYTCDAAGLITYFNQRAAELWGREPKLNDPVDRFCGSFRLFSCDGVPICHDQCWMALALRDRKEYNGHEILIERPDGTRRIASAHANPFLDEHGRLAGAVNVLVDITSHKRDQEVLAERNRLTALRADVSSALALPQPTRQALQHCCEALVRHLDMAFARIWILNPEDNVLELEASAGLYTHLDGPHGRIRVGELKIGRIAQNRQPHLTNDVAHDPHVSSPDWAQREGMVAFAGYPLVVEGRVVGVVAMFARRPLSEAVLADLAPLADSIALYVDHKQAEERLREEMRIAETLHRLGSLLAAELDLDELVQTVTDEATSLTGAQFGALFYNLSGEQGERYMLYTLSGAPRAAFEKFPMPRNTAIFDPTFRGEGAVRLDDVTQDPRFGKNAPYFGMPEGHLPVRSYLAVPVVSRSGEVLGGLFFGHSQVGVFNERHESLAVGVAAQAAVAIDNALLYRQAQEQANRLREADRRKDEFLATLAHELRNPLAPIRSGLELMRMAGNDPAVVEEIRGMMEGQAQQLVRLVDDLLDVSRITSGKMMLRKTRVELAAVVQSALEATRRGMEESGHELTVFLPDERIVLEADPTRLAQILSNLLSNAARYTEKGGRIWLSAERQGSDVVIRVKDTGVGIPPDMLQRIFEMFTQVDRSLERSQSGLGIGLMLVKRLVEMHGGSVEARSDGSGKGSEFLVRLPLAIERLAEERVARDDAVFEAAGRRILVVDDNRDAAKVLSMMLRSLGNDVRTAYDGLEALEAAAEFHPHVVLMDLGMPKFSGYEAAQTMRQQPWGAAAVLVALTGWGNEEDKQRTKQAGFDHHLVKPVELASLQKLLAEFQPRAA